MQTHRFSGSIGAPPRLRLRHLLLTLGCSMLLAACGGGDDAAPPAVTTPPTTTPPVIAPDNRPEPPTVGVSSASVSLGQSLTLEASSSASGTLQWRWQLITRPEGSQARLSSPESASTSFTPDLPGDYAASVLVNNGQANSDPAHIRFAATNPEPVAVIAPASGRSGQQVQLDASASLPPHGAERSGLRFAWVLLSTPEGSQAQLDNPQAEKPRFTADVEGQYLVSLQVAHGEKTSPLVQSTVVVAKTHAPPVAVILGATQATSGQRVALDGSTSTASDGAPLQYRWAFHLKPRGSAASLDGADTAHASFVPDMAGNYQVTLSLYDGRAISVQKIHFLQITRADNAPNNLPQARINFTNAMGTEQLGNELELGDTAYLTHVYSHDADADPLTAEWTLLSAPQGVDVESFYHPVTRWDKARLLLTHAGEYTVRLRVYDGQDWSAPEQTTFTARTGANRFPRADARTATGGRSALTGQALALDATHSSDPDDNRLDYRWVMTDRPDHSQSQLQNPYTVEPQFTPDRPGPYRFSLEVTDEHGWTSPEAQLLVLAKEQNHAPSIRPEIARLYAPEKIYFRAPNAQTFIDPFGYDPDGDELSYLYAIEQSPGLELLNNYNFSCAQQPISFGPPPITPHSSALLTCPSGFLITGETSIRTPIGADRMLIPPAPHGDYVLHVTASDGISTSDTVTLRFRLIDSVNCQKDYDGQPGRIVEGNECVSPELLQQP